MIPRIIHYCWFGGRPFPKLEEHCVNSWSRVMKDYQVIKWDENSFDMTSSPFVQAAYNAGKFAFVADYVRLYALKLYGGIYLDTDVELLKSLDPFLDYEAFSGFETHKVIQTGVLGSEPNNIILNEFYEVYQHMSFTSPPPNSAILTDILVRHGLKLDNSRQRISNMEIFPQEYFCPINQATRQICCTDKTHAIHYLSGSWLPLRARITNKMKRSLGSSFHGGYAFISFLRKFFK